METRRIGSLEVSAVGLGCNNFGWRLNEQATTSVIHAALDAGVTFFDTADIYCGTKSEEYLGRTLKARRKEVVIATKFGSALDDRRRGARPEYVKQACAASLRRLGTDYLDLYQLHRPDPSVPIEETLGALHELVQAGQVREIGCSNFSPVEIRAAEMAAQAKETARFISVQNEYSLLYREPEHGVLQECERLGLAFIPYFPLASGLLTGKYRRHQPPPQGTRLSERFGDVRTDPRLQVVEALLEFAESRGHTLLELAISWLLIHSPVASVIAGATKPEQVRANAAAGWRLQEEELAQVNDLLTNFPMAA